MRGTKAKQLKKYAIRLFVEASQDKKNEEFLRSSYMVNPKTGQIMRAGFKGICQSVKRMYRNDEEVTE